MATNLDRGGGLENSNLQPGSTGNEGGTSSSGSGGGVPAAHLRQDNDNDLGLFIGLEHEDAGPDWLLDKIDRETSANVAQATVVITVSSTTLTLTLPAALAEGARGNRWQVRFVTPTTSRPVGVPDFETAERTIYLPNGGVTSLGYFRDQLNSAYSGMAVLAGTDTTAPTSGTHAFAGGTGNDPIRAELVEASKTVELFYDASDSQQDILTAIHEQDVTNGRILATALAGTALNRSPKPPSGNSRIFNRFYAQGQQPASTSTGDGTEQQISGTFTEATLTLTLSPGNTFSVAVPADLARDTETAAAINSLRDLLRGGAPANRDTLKELADAIAAIVPGATWLAPADAEPSGGSDGQWALRTGATNPGIYYRSGGSWTRVLAPGTGGTATLTDAAVLDLAQSSRDSADRGKPLGVSLTDENDLVLLNEPSLGLTPVGGTLNVPNSSSSNVDGPAMDDLADLIYLDLNYTRTTANLKMSGMLRKSLITSSGARFQLQGAGPAYISLTNNSGTLRVVSEANSSGISSIELSIFNVSGGTKGDKGDDGDLSAVSSDATLTGDGTSADPLKVANPFTDTDESKLDGIETGATAEAAATNAHVDAVTATTSTLAGLLSSARSSWNDANFLTVRKATRLLDRVVKRASRTVIGVTDYATNAEADANEASAVDTAAITPSSWWRMFTGARIKARLEALTGANRLDASAIQNLPAAGSSSSGGHDSEDHRRISALEEKTQELELRTHDAWTAATGIANYALFILSGSTAINISNLPGYAWAVSQTLVSGGSFRILLRVGTGRHTNIARVRRVDSSDVEQEIYHGGWTYAGLEQSGFDYYVRDVDDMASGDVLTLQLATVEEYTEYSGEVEKLNEHGRLAHAHQDSPQRVSGLSPGAPSGRQVYLSGDITHPLSEHIFEVPLSNLSTSVIGASVVDLSGEDGPGVASSTSGYPAVMNAARIAAIWQVNDTRVFRIAVNGGIGTPTHIHVDGYGFDHRFSLTQEKVATVSGTAYRFMVTETSGSAFALLETLLNNSDPLDFSLSYGSGGFLQSDGTLDDGIDLDAGHYDSFGDGIWRPHFTPIAMDQAALQFSSPSVNDLRDAIKTATPVRVRTVSATQVDITGVFTAGTGQYIRLYFADFWVPEEIRVQSTDGSFPVMATAEMSTVGQVRYLGRNWVVYEAGAAVTTMAGSVIIRVNVDTEINERIEDFADRQMQNSPVPPNRLLIGDTDGKFGDPINGAQSWVWHDGTTFTVNQWVLNSLGTMDGHGHFFVASHLTAFRDSFLDVADAANPVYWRFNDSTIIEGYWTRNTADSIRFHGDMSSLRGETITSIRYGTLLQSATEIEERIAAGIVAAARRQRQTVVVFGRFEDALVMGQPATPPSPTGVTYDDNTGPSISSGSWVLPGSTYPTVGNLWKATLIFQYTMGAWVRSSAVYERVDAGTLLYSLSLDGSDPSDTLPSGWDTSTTATFATVQGDGQLSPWTRRDQRPETEELLFEITAPSAGWGTAQATDTSHPGGQFILDDYVELRARMTAVEPPEHANAGKLYYDSGDGARYRRVSNIEVHDWDQSSADYGMLRVALDGANVSQTLAVVNVAHGLTSYSAPGYGTNYGGCILDLIFRKRQVNPSSDRHVQNVYALSGRGDVRGTLRIYGVRI